MKSLFSLIVSFILISCSGGGGGNSGSKKTQQKLKTLLQFGELGNLLMEMELTL